ncbi:MAG: von Willebrand factor type A domain-containing protein [Chthoniobacteraceae bacterium]
MKLADAEVARSSRARTDGLGIPGEEPAAGSRLAVSKPSASRQVNGPDEPVEVSAFVVPPTGVDTLVTGPAPALPAIPAGPRIAGIDVEDAGRGTVSRADRETAAPEHFFDSRDKLARSETASAVAAGLGRATLASTVGDQPANEDFLGKNLAPLRHAAGGMKSPDDAIAGTEVVSQYVSRGLIFEDQGAIGQADANTDIKSGNQPAKDNWFGRTQDDFGIAPADPLAASSSIEDAEASTDHIELGFAMNIRRESVGEVRFGNETGPTLTRERELAQKDGKAYYNRTISPEIRDKVEQVKQKSAAAKGLMETGRTDLALKRTEQILDIDPYNLEARKMQEEIKAATNDPSIARNEARSQALWRVDAAWAMPVRKFGVPADEAAIPTPADPLATAKESELSESLAQARDFDVSGSVESKADEANALFGYTDLNDPGKFPYYRGRGVEETGRSVFEGVDAKESEPLATLPAVAEAVDPALRTIDRFDTKLVELGDLARAGAGKDAVTTTPNEFALGEIPAAPRLLRAGVDGKPADPNTSLSTAVPATDGQSTELAKLEKPKQRAAAQEFDDQAPAAKPAEPAPEPQPEIATSTNAFSTFSLNVSDVAFKLAAASLEKGQMPELATVRSEEFINAFDYRDPEPAAGAPLAFASELARYPFAQNRDLLRLSVKTAATGREPGRPLNLVLLLDNSGSMERADRVRILHEALRVLSAQLHPRDKLSIITFARTPRLWADGVAGDKAGETTARVSEITPQGGTNLSAALDLGYETALKHYQPGSINRVVLLTDGAANLGNVNPDALKQKVETNRQKGVALDCFGVGWEGYDDSVLEALSRNGDGRYGFINSPEEAATEFAGQLAGALRVAASDVKVQVEWNPRRVTAYRQIGYAKHQLKKEQFRDNTVDAAEIGAAESGNALYVIEVNPQGEGDLATVRVRFKVPGTSDYKENEWTVPYTPNTPSLDQASPALRLAGTASAFSEWLVSSPYATEVAPDRLLGLLNGVPAIYGADPRPQKLEWMIRTAKNVSGR